MNASPVVLEAMANGGNPQDRLASLLGRGTVHQNNFAEITKKQLVQPKYSCSLAKTRQQTYDQDSVQNYLQAIARVPLLSGEEEIVLSRKIKDLLYLENIRQQLRNKLGRQPSDLEWSQEVNLSLNAFRHRLFLGRQAKNKMVQSNLQLVVFVAKKYLKRGLSFQDLIQEGNFGLIRAVDKFDPEQGCKFSTYAYWWIRQAILRAIAEQSRTIRLPIHIYNKLSRIKKTFRHLSQKLQRQPSETEMAESLNMSVKQFRFVLEAAQMPFSLELPVTRDEDSCSIEDYIVSDLITPEQWIVNQSMHEDVENILSSLDSRERDILRLRYGLDSGMIKTPAEVAQMFNLSREEINQIRRRTIDKLRRRHGNSDSKEYLF
ncbi:MAG: sigma-70 family RNA polymerase sigma factor [Cyanobacteria bacterium P01_G01_bin.39]